MRHLRNLALYLLSLLPLMAGAADGIVIVVNQAAGIETLSRSDVINIFMGRFRQLPSGATAKLHANPGGIAYLERSRVTSREKIVFELPAP